jgi:primase-polymerase (primpol)-like protein
MTATKPHTLKSDLAHLPAALAPLVALDHWLLWRWEQRRGIWTKPPFSVTGVRAKNNDPTTWSTYAAALVAVQNGSKFDGIGFALLGTPFDRRPS